jgi:putative ABC transport system permease protein
MAPSPFRFPRGVRRLFRLPASRARLIRDADEELTFHLEMWKAEFRACGMSEDEAAAAAEQRFGSPDGFRRYSVDRASRVARWSHVVEWWQDWGQDIRFAIRKIGKSPRLSAGIVTTLALGIGANTAIFSVIHHLLLEPLPYRNGDRVVALRVKGGGMFASLASMSGDRPGYPPSELVQAWAERSHSLEAIGGVERMFLATDRTGRQDTLSHVFVTANFLPLLGARPALGRGFLPDEERPGNDRVAMISYEWWQRAYAGQRDLLGQTIEYEGNPYTIVGVMPRDFVLPMSPRQLDELSMTAPDMWMPAPLANVGMPIGLLRRGTTPDAATRELQTIANTVRIRNSPDTLRALIMRPQDFLAPRAVSTMQVLFVAVGVLLLIACANVANLLLAKAWTRRREFAVRMGLGAGRSRLVRLALTESVLLALMAGMAGIAVAWASLGIIVRLRPIALDELATVQIAPSVLLWTTAISVATGILFGGATAVFVGSRNVGDLLRGDTRTASESRGSRRLRASLIVAEIALSLVLLVGAGLLTRSLLALQQTNLGFDPKGLVSVDVLVPPEIGRRPDAVGRIREAIVQRLRLVPGVLDAAVGTLPTAGFRVPRPLVTEGTGGNRSIGVTDYQTAWIDRDYFRVSAIELVAGRLPDAGASDLSQPPFRGLSEEIVVNGAFARRIVPNGNVLGMRIKAADAGGGRFAPADVWSTIVGISDDVQLPGVRGDLESYQIYSMPLARMPNSIYVVRMTVVPPDVESELRSALQDVTPTLIARRARVADDYVREALAPTRFALGLIGAFALIALTLSAVGLYGTIAYAVSQRTRELGIRIALGATRQAVVRMLLDDGIRLVMVGLAVGLTLAALLSRSLAKLLYGVTPGDPVTFVVIAFLVATITLLASYVPARRALRIDPVEALRLE